MKHAVGLRIDVDTFGGFTRAVIPLTRVLARLHLKATFFLISGQESPLRGFPRLFTERGFARRVLRLRGSIWRACGSGGTPVKESIAAIREGHHELALHGLHHFSWQLHLREWGIERIEQEIAHAYDGFRLLTGTIPRAFAAPGWETSEEFFTVEDRFGFAYASDTRGSSPFYPVVKGKCMRTLQIPVTLPTLDEMIALDDAQQLIRLELGDGDVYCAHAEFDGTTHLPLFTRFLEENMRKGCTFVPLAEMAIRAHHAATCDLAYRFVPGRTRRVTYQKKEEVRRQRREC